LLVRRTNARESASVGARAHFARLADVALARIDRILPEAGDRIFVARIAEKYVIVQRIFLLFARVANALVAGVLGAATDQKRQHNQQIFHVVPQVSSAILSSISDVSTANFSLDLRLSPKVLKSWH